MAEPEEIKNIKKIYRDFDKRDKWHNLKTPAIITLASSFFLWFFMVAQKTSDITFKNREQRDMVIQRTAEPLATKRELDKEIRHVKHEIAVGDTMVLRMSKAEYILLNNDIANINKNLKNLATEQKSFSVKMEKQTDRIIDIIKAQK